MAASSRRDRTIPVRGRGTCRDNALYPALWTARRGVDGRHQSVFVSVVSAQRQQAPSGRPVADLVNAGSDEGVEGLSSVSLAATHGVAGAVDDRYQR